MEKYKAEKLLWGTFEIFENCNNSFFLFFCDNNLILIKKTLKELQKSLKFKALANWKLKLYFVHLDQNKKGSNNSNLYNFH